MVRYYGWYSNKMRIVWLINDAQIIDRGVTLNARNRRFKVDLSGACPRRWKSELQSIPHRAYE